MMEQYKKGLVSVIIPTYKRADTLSRAIQSVEDQTYRNIEILVVDDNEPGDEYSRQIKNLIEQLGFDNLILVTQQKHINGAAARNAGIKKASGEYIAFLDDDDLWMPEKIEKQVEVIKSLNASYGGVSTRKIYLTDGKLTQISEAWRTDKKQNFKIMAKLLNVSTCTLLLRHSCLDETGYFDERLKRHQEIQLLTFFTNKYKVHYIDEILTIIDCSDLGNRPTADLLIKYKSDYFNAIQPLLTHYSKHKQKLIIAHNMTEVAWAVFRDGNKGNGIRRLLKCLIHPSVLYSFSKRVLEKYKSRKALNSYDQDKINQIRNYIKQVSIY